MSRDKEAAIRVDIKWAGAPIERTVAEHEVMFSFFDDTGAAEFYEWWNSKGHKAFADWCQEDED